ncbi:hypothetical protein [Actinomadura sp. K4S16]
MDLSESAETLGARTTGRIARQAILNTPQVNTSGETWWTRT